MIKLNVQLLCILIFYDSIFADYFILHNCKSVFCYFVTPTVNKTDLTASYLVVKAAIKGKD